MVFVSLLHSSFCLLIETYSASVPSYAVVLIAFFVVYCWYRSVFTSIVTACDQLYNRRLSSSFLPENLRKEAILSADGVSSELVDILNSG